MIQAQEPLPIDMIRAHLRIDEQIDEPLLTLYRDAAFEECERWTGLVLRPRHVDNVVTTVNGLAILDPAPTSPVTMFEFNGTRWMQIGTFHSAGDTVSALPYYSAYGGFASAETLIPGGPCVMDCTNCGAQPNGQIRVVYDVAAMARVPAAVILGCLKYIGYAYGHRGDATDATSWALQSGAMIHWRGYQKAAA